jgi:3-deoxy-D-manno-octulosonate 8-phosphate phosphatase (KDO 8-P phosphatase)
LATISAEIRERAARIRLVVLDSDGVLTDGRIIVSSDGAEARAFDVTDGFGIRLAQKAGIEFAIVSGRRSDVVEGRARDLNVSEVHQRIWDKRGCVQEIRQRLRIPADAVCFVGDDLIDVPAMREAGLAAAPSTARPEVAEVAHYVADRAGGRGAVREIVDLILRSSGRWEEATRSFLEPEGA